MEFNTQEYSDFVANMDIIFRKAEDTIPMVVRNSGLYNELVIQMNTGDSRTFSNTDIEKFASVKPEGDASVRAKVAQGPKITGYLRSFSLEIGITHEMRTRGKYMEIQKMISDLGKSGRERMELDLTHRLTFGTDTSYTDKDQQVVSLTVADGYQLFYTAHTVAGSATTFRNRLANNPKFSSGALRAMQAMRISNSITENGELKPVTDDVIWHGSNPDVRDAVAQVLRSSADPTQNNSGVINTQAGKYRQVELPYLATTAAGTPDSTKENYWGVASTSTTTAYLGVLEEPHMITSVAGGNAQDFATLDLNFKNFGQWMILIADPSWIAVSTGDATA